MLQSIVQQNMLGYEGGKLLYIYIYIYIGPRSKSSFLRICSSFRASARELQSIQICQSYSEIGVTITNFLVYCV